jgi:hypothetical protein
MQPRRLLRRLVVVGVLLLVLPLGCIEGVYRYGLSRVQAYPSPPAESDLPQNVATLLWAGLGERGAMDVRPVYPWHVFFWTGGGLSRELLGFSHGEAVQPTHGQFAVRRVSAEHLTRPMRTAEWKLTNWALAIWLTRHWTAKQVLSDFASTRGFSDAAKDLFGKELASLDMERLVLLIALRDDLIDPVCHPDRAQRARDRVLERLHGARIIDDQARTALASSSVLTLIAPDYSCKEVATGGH